MISNFERVELMEFQRHRINEISEIRKRVELFLKTLNLEISLLLLLLLFGKHYANIKCVATKFPANCASRNLQRNAHLCGLARRKPSHQSG